MSEGLIITNQKDLDELLAKYAIQGVTNKPALMYQMEESMRAQKGGFPKWMHHASLLPRQAMNDGQLDVLRRQGYKEHYIAHDWPQMLFRRNMDPKFDLPDGQHGSPGDFIEMRQFRSQEAFELATRERVPKTVVGTWMASIGDLPPISNEDAIDKDVRIAQLEAQLAGARGEDTVAPKAKKSARKAA